MDKLIYILDKVSKVLTTALFIAILLFVLWGFITY